MPGARNTTPRKPTHDDNREQKVAATLLKAFPQHDDRSEYVSDYFDHCWSVSLKPLRPLLLKGNSDANSDAGYQFPYPHTDAGVAANRWEEVTQEYRDMMLRLRHSGHLAQCPLDTFAVGGEPLSHMDDGRVVRQFVLKVDGKFYAKPYPVARFNPDTFVSEIAAQS